MVIIRLLGYKGLWKKSWKCKKPDCDIYLETLDSPLATIFVDRKRRLTIDAGLEGQGDKTVQEWVITEVGTQHLQVQGAAEILLTDSLERGRVQAMG